MNYGSKHSELHRRLCNMKIIEKITKKKYPIKLINLVLKKLINQQNQKTSTIIQNNQHNTPRKKSKLSICFQ